MSSTNQQFKLHTVFPSSATPGIGGQANISYTDSDLISSLAGLLAASFTGITGPTGPTGPTGSTGPTGTFPASSTGLTLNFLTVSNSFTGTTVHIGTGSFTDMTGTNLQVSSLTGTTVYIGTGTFLNTTVTNSRVTAFTGTTVSAVSLTVGTGTFTDLSGSNLLVTSLTGTTVRGSTGIFIDTTVTNQVVTAFTGTKVYIGTGTFTDMTGTNLQVLSFTGTTVHISTGIFTDVTATNELVTAFTGTTVYIGTGTFTDLSGTNLRLTAFTGTTVYIGTGSFTDMTGVNLRVTSFTGTTVMASALQLATVGGTPGNLNYYEEFTSTFTPAGAITTADLITLYIIRIGRICIAFMPQFSFTATSTAAVTISTVPARFDRIAAGGNVINNFLQLSAAGVPTTGVWQLAAASGTHILYADTALANFTNTLAYVVGGNTMCWVTA